MSNNTPIDLASDKLLDSDVVEILSLHSKERFISVWDAKRNGPLLVPDFGTIFVGFDDIFSQVENLNCFIRENEETPLVMPIAWKQGHLAKRLGMFPSVSQATKNGFSAEIPNGFSQIFVRVNKNKGIISILKNTIDS